VPERKGMGELVLSKIWTEIGVMMATPWGRMRGEIPRRESEIRQSRAGNRQRRERLCGEKTVRL
jgi:hypothetical protein